MKKLLLTLIVSFLLLPFTASAQLDLGGGYLNKARANAGYGTANETTLAATIGSIVNVTLSLVGVIFLLLTVYAGFLWMTASGDEGKVDKAQSIIRAAVIGLIVIVGAYSITNFVVTPIVEKTTSDTAAQEDSSADVGGQSAANNQLVTCCRLCEVAGVACSEINIIKGINAGQCTNQCENTPGCVEVEFERVPASECR